jgi:hypothetical protein
MYMAVFTHEFEMWGMATPVPGLVVSPALRWRHEGSLIYAVPGRWAVVHTRSGLAVVPQVTNPEAALEAAVLVGPEADWTQPAAALRAALSTQSMLALIGRFIAEDYTWPSTPVPTSDRERVLNR